MNPHIRIVIADDQELIRYGLTTLINMESGMEVVGEAADGAEAVAQVTTLRPHILLLDLLMPGSSGLNVIDEISRQCPQTRILILTGLIDDESILQALQLGAAGFLPKTASPTELVQAIRAVAGGGMPLHPQVASVVVRKLNQPPPTPILQSQLTARERQVLDLLARGSSNNEIAKALFISTYTVRTHICKVLKKLNVTNRTQAALYVLKHGIDQLPEP